MSKRGLQQISRVLFCEPGPHLVAYGLDEAPMSLPETLFYSPNVYPRAIKLNHLPTMVGLCNQWMTDLYVPNKICNENEVPIST